MKPLVSVIVPIYNAAAFIVETLDSILASSYRPIEVVMVDDGSSDDSLGIASTYCKDHEECYVYKQENAGVSAARNHAIRKARGVYILPVDADDKIGSTYIEHAVQILENDPNIRVVGCHARMFDGIDKEWKLPTFSHALLARKNMIPVSSMFRKKDWEACGGFCEEDIYREDWDFWLSMMELGGTFYKLEEVGFYYRIRKNSRRSTAKGHKKQIVDAINRRHSDYLQRYLGGPLHYHRSWSKLINLFRSEHVVGDYSHWEEGDVLYAKRNILRSYQDCISKQFATPSFFKGLYYGLVGKSKAKRSYLYACKLQGLTPHPIAYKEVRYMGILRESWYVCKQSTCPYTFNDLIGNEDFPNRASILHAIGLFTARLHQQGIEHQDYSGGNILFNADGSQIEIVDLNRIRFHHTLSMQKGLTNFERLNIDQQALSVMVAAYAQAMGYDIDNSIRYVCTHRWKKHVRQGITNL